MLTSSVLNVLLSASWMAIGSLLTIATAGDSSIYTTANGIPLFSTSTGGSLTCRTVTVVTATVELTSPSLTTNSILLIPSEGSASLL